MLSFITAFGPMVVPVKPLRPSGIDIPPLFSAVLPKISPPYMLNLPQLRTPPPSSLAVLSVILPPLILNVVLAVFMWTPPPRYAVLSDISPSVIVNVELLLTYTPPPKPRPMLVASLSVILPPVIVNVELLPVIATAPPKLFITLLLHKTTPMFMVNSPLLLSLTREPWLLL